MIDSTKTEGNGVKPSEKDLVSEPLDPKPVKEPVITLNLFVLAESNECSIRNRVKTILNDTFKAYNLKFELVDIRNEFEFVDKPSWMVDMMTKMVQSAAIVVDDTYSPDYQFFTNFLYTSGMPRVRIFTKRDLRYRTDWETYDDLDLYKIKDFSDFIRNPPRHFC